MLMGEHDIRCVNHGGCCAEDKLIQEIKKLRERIRPFDNGRGEGEYFADELTDLLEGLGIDAT